MPLLLLLSAILSTLTGVVTGGRVPGLLAQNCAVAADPVRVAAIALSPRLAGHRHLLDAIELRPTFAASTPPAQRTPVPRLYLDRLRA